MTLDLRWFDGHRRRLAKRACKVALAAVIATVVARTFDLRFPWFATLAAIVTMELTLRTSLRAGRDGVIGAVVGAVTGIGFALIGKDQAWAVGAVVLIALLVLSWLGNPAAGRQAAFIGSVIVLVPAETIAPFDFAWVRFVETIIGVASAIAVNALVFPPRAYRNVRRALGDAYVNLAQLYRLVMQTAATGTRDEPPIVAARRGFRAAMRRVDDLWDEAVAESPSDEVLDTGWRRITRRIWEQCTAMDDALMDPHAHTVLDPARPELDSLARATTDTLDAVAHAFSEGLPMPDTRALEPIRHTFLHRVEELDIPAQPFTVTMQAIAFANGMTTIAARLIDLSEPRADVETP